MHKYANEDVSLGAWFIGLEVEHVDDRSMCCGTVECALRARDSDFCVASFDWDCSGICQSVNRIRGIHNMCGESSDALSNAI